MNSLVIKHNIWCSINIIYFIIYLYLVLQGLVIVLKYEDELNEEGPIFNGLIYGITIDFIMLFIFLLKGVLIIFYKNEKTITNNDINSRIYAMEWISALPYYIHFFYTFCQISYFYSNKFKNKKDLLKIREFKEYCLIKIIFGILFMTYFSLVNIYLFIKKLGDVCYNCCYCRDCLFDEKKYKINPS